MTADTLTSMVPQLRFPEFHDTGEWEVEQLGSVCELYQPETLAASRLKQDGPYLVYGANGVIGKHDRYNHEDSEVVVTCRGATCGEVNRTQPKSWITGNAMVVRPKDDRISKDFVFYLLKSDGLKFVVSGSAQPQITRAGFSPFLFVFPERKKEQQCIADCLGSLDGLIAAQGRKLEILRQHKQGLMQQLFPRPGETAPQLRFPEFHDAGEWDEKKLSNLFHLQDGFAFKSIDFVKYKEGATQVIRITDINKKNTNDDKVYIPNTYIEENNLNRYSVDNGDLLLSLTGAAGFRFFLWDGGRAVINQRTAKFSTKKESNSDLIRLLEPLVHEKINARGEGQNNNLSKEFLSGVMLFVPSPAEQRKIADCLGSLDGLIAAQGRKLETLRQHKQGLLQRLFPSMEAE